VKDASILKVQMTYPVAVLLVAALEVQHPVSKRLEGGGSQTSPDAGKHAVVETTSHIVQLTAHPDLSGKSLRTEGTLRESKENRQFNAVDE
jgi:hypothetical protein